MTTPILPAQPPELLVPVHKALRRFMFDTLVLVGALDVTDRAERERTLNQVERLLQLLREPAETLRQPLDALRAGPASQRPAQAAQLYRGLAQCTAQRLAAMAEAELAAEGLDTPSSADPARSGLRRDRLGSLEPAELREALGWMSEALSPQELAGLLDDLHAGTPAATFRVALEVVNARLDDDRWNRVARALGIAQVTVAPPTLPLAA
jgi:hypothetical protein